MKLTVKIARILDRLINYESIPSSSAKSKLIDELVQENILIRKGKQRKTIELLDEEALHMYLYNQLQINDFDDYLSTLENETSSRAEHVRVSTDSKNSRERAFKGFLVNCYQLIKAELNNQEFLIDPKPGSFIFIYDFESFKIPKDITIVGVENSKNFSEIVKQKYLFEDIRPLFISRYPQNQNNDFIKWMNSIPNDYLHFGDFDLAGIGIYINEYQKKISGRSSFFIPKNIEVILPKYGNRNRYDVQNANFKLEDIVDKQLLDLVSFISINKKGLDQEYFIGEE